MKLVHDGRKVIAKIDNETTNVVTSQIVFSGTSGECDEEIKRLGLKEPTPQNRRVDDHSSSELVTGHSSQVTS